MSMDKDIPKKNAFGWKRFLKEEDTDEPPKKKIGGWRGFFIDNPENKAKLFMVLWYISLLMLIIGVGIFIFKEF